MTTESKFSPFIVSQFSPSLLGRMPLLFLKALKLAEEVFNDTPCLRVLSLQKGDIRNAAVDFVVSQHLAATKYEGVDHSFLNYGVFEMADGKKSKAKGHYLQIETGLATMTISHVHERFALPRPANLRKSLPTALNAFMFSEMEEIRQRALDQAKSICEKQHLLMTYGNEGLEFLHIGVIDSKNKMWRETPLDLLARPYVVVDHNDDDMEATNTSVSMGVKKEFIQQISENASGQ